MNLTFWKTELDWAEGSLLVQEGGERRLDNSLEPVAKVEINALNWVKREGQNPRHQSS